MKINCTFVYFPSYITNKVKKIKKILCIDKVIVYNNRKNKEREKWKTLRKNMD